MEQLLKKLNELPELREAVSSLENGRSPVAVSGLQIAHRAAVGAAIAASMETTLPTHSVFLSWHLSYAVGDPVPERGAIVLFDSDELGETLVKRVVGLPGETVSFRDGQVLINGTALEETYLPVQGITYPQNEGDSFTVPDGCVFLMGDHRDDSLDSRFWQDPFVPVSNIRSRALVDFSLWPGNTWLGVRRVG